MNSCVECVKELGRRTGNSLPPIAHGAVRILNRDGLETPLARIGF